MEKQMKTDDFIQDWELKIEEKSARHKSGLEIEYVYDNPDGTIYVELKELTEWMKSQLESVRDSKEVRKLANRLVNEFTIIYKEKMTIINK